MQDKKIMDAVRRYLKEQNISDKQILKEIHLDISGEEELSAGEFLILCSHLQMPPQYFMSQTEKSYSVGRQKEENV